ADANDAVPPEARVPVGGLQRARRRLLGAFEIVRGILSRQVRLARIEDDAVLAAAIVEDRRANGLAVGAVDDDGADRVRAVVQSEGVDGCHVRRPLGHVPRATCQVPRAYVTGATCHVPRARATSARATSARSTSHVARLHVRTCARGTWHAAR